MEHFSQTVVNLTKAIGTLFLVTIILGAPVLFGVESVLLANKTISELGTWLWSITGVIVVLEVISVWIGLLAIVGYYEEEDKDEISTSGNKGDN